MCCKNVETEQNQVKITVRIGLCCFSHLNSHKILRFSIFFFFFFPWEGRVSNITDVLTGLLAMTPEKVEPTSLHKQPSSINLIDPHGPHCKQYHPSIWQNKLFPTEDHLHTSHSKWLSSNQRPNPTHYQVQWVDRARQNTKMSPFGKYFFSYLMCPLLFFF